ncbi:hypothetical protein AJ80_01502 [Polytolypa hystricis UAMH7299]|uniref:Uncharacterized protein n=1 Tax=Polytolypa hystricis (strain UAMH7299) TaxID=1447883 RepID=A0A2B7Z0T2_POLH7|nr:hypothetical protein AJ80_01502 [Polytolypa hystricis UAMH7299]
MGKSTTSSRLSDQVFKDEITDLMGRQRPAEEIMRKLDILCLNKTGLHADLFHKMKEEGKSREVILQTFEKKFNIIPRIPHTRILRERVYNEIIRMHGTGCSAGQIGRHLINLCGSSEGTFGELVNDMLAAKWTEEQIAFKIANCVGVNLSRDISY